MSIVVVTGKPGTGKSLVLTLMARKSLRRGTRTLTDFPVCDWMYASAIFQVLGNIPIIRWLLYWIMRTHLRWPGFVDRVDQKMVKLPFLGKLKKYSYRVPYLSSRYWLPPVLYGLVFGAFCWTNNFYLYDFERGFLVAFVLKAAWPLYFEIPREKLSKVRYLRPISNIMHRFWTWIKAVDLEFSCKFNPKKDSLASVYCSDMYIDEAQRYYPSIKFKDFTDEERDFFMLQRHNDNMIYLGTGHISRLNINIRQYANEIWDLRSFKIPFTTRPFLVLVNKYGSEQEMERGQKYRTSIIFPRQADFDAYSTKQYRTADRGNEMKYRKWSFEDVIR